MKKWVNNLILGSVVLILTLASLVYSAILENSWIEEFLARPGVYMALVLGVLALLALLLVIRGWQQRKTEAGQAYQPPIWTATPICTVVILFIYLLVLDKLGFILDSIAMLWSLMFLYSMESGKDRKDKKIVIKEAVKSGLFAIAFSLAVYCVFTKILSTRLPVFRLF